MSNKGFNDGGGYIQFRPVGGVPDAPAALRLASTGADSVTATWTAPTVSGPSEWDSLLGYHVQYSTDGGSSWIDASDLSPTATSTTVASLFCSGTAMLRVAAYNLLGAAPWSTTNSAMVGAERLRVCPGDPTVMAAGQVARIPIVGASPLSSTLIASVGGATTIVPVNADGVAYLTWTPGAAGKIKIT
ncbi:MAG: fibronectin type III domain-containing protein, partial [Actinomycetales bacterium]|nr:fibronectin type III domain-containing protein [Actinomycetales bacterium]